MKSIAFSKSYDGVSVLSMPDFDWDPGSIYAVIGANGSGKSTLAKILSGTLQSDQNQRPAADAKIGYLPQKPYAFRMRVDRNIRLNGKDAKRSENLLNALGLRELRQKQAQKLSGGETAKLALARLLMRDYELLILDEPTAAMDMESTAAAEKLIRDYRKQTNCAVILITHSIQQARRVSDRILYLENGQLIESGETDRLLQNPSKPETRRFLQFFGYQNLS